MDILALYPQNAKEAGSWIFYQPSFLYCFSCCGFSETPSISHLQHFKTVDCPTITSA